LLVLPVPLLSVALLALWLADTPAAITARYALADCRHVEVEADGARLTGIEDIAPLPGGQVLLSARDRRSGVAGTGGLYIADLPDFDARDTVPARRVAGAGEGLDPHGVAVSAEGARLAFVDAPGTERASVIWGDLERGRFLEAGRVSGIEWCRANDLGFHGGALYVSRDRASCGTSVADLMPGSRTGSVARIDLATAGAETAAEGLSFANGVQAWQGRLMVAETRGDRIAVLDGAETIALPGGPDNLSLAPDGSLIVAVQPHLLRLALWMAGITGSAPSRIARIDPATRDFEIVVDDPAGSLLSGVTVAVMTGRHVIAGSAFDRGLLVCGPMA
jgi:hypothetical protein